MTQRTAIDGYKNPGNIGGLKSLKRDRSGFESIGNLGAYKRLGYINANVDVTKASAATVDWRPRINPRKSRSWT